jgi:hypothetical protein
VRVEFTNDELILTLVSLIRATDPNLMRHGPDGIQIDFEKIEKKQTHTEDERLLLRLRGALDTACEQDSYGLELILTDRQRLAEVLAQLNSMKRWPGDVVAMSQSLQERLLAGE